MGTKPKYPQVPEDLKKQVFEYWLLTGDPYHAILKKFNINANQAKIGRIIEEGLDQRKLRKQEDNKLQ